MSLLRKGLKKLVTTIAVVAVLASSVGFNNTMIYADSNVNKVIEKSSQEKHIIKNEIKVVPSDSINNMEYTYSILRSAVSEDTVIEVKDGKKYLTIEFTDNNYHGTNLKLYDFLSDIRIIVDGVEHKFTKNQNKLYSIELPSLESNIQLGCKLMGKNNYLIDVFLSENEIKDKFPDVIEEKHLIKNEIKVVPSDSITNMEYTYNILRSAISEDTVIELKGEKKYLTIEFTDNNYHGTNLKLYDFLDDIRIIVDGVEHKFNKSENKLYSIELPSLESNIQLSCKLMGKTTYLMDIVLLEDKEEEDLPTEEEENLPTDEEENDAISGATHEVPDESTSDVATNRLKDGNYTIKNNTVYKNDSEIGNLMIRNSLEELSYIEVKNGEVYITLEFIEYMYSNMNNVKITVDGESVQPIINGNKYKIKVKSINSKIGITADIGAMGGMNVAYSVIFEESTLKQISSTDSTTSSSTSSSTTNNSTSSSTSSNSSTTTESVAKKGKLYTIQNTVDYENQTGKDMARMYLNSTSKVELIDGQYYVTLTFTGAQYMKNHAIYVNGSKVSHSVTSKSDDAISLRFKVSKLSDTIGVGMYVAPMSRDIKFTVKLLENTLKFVKEYEVSSQVESVSTEEETIEEIEETTTEEEVTENTVDTQTEVEAATATSNSTKGAVLYTTIGIALGSALTVAIGAIRKRKMQ